MISVSVSGSFANTEAALQRIKRREQFAALSKYGQIGVNALEQATPKDSSATSRSWYYQIVDKPGYYAIHWYNSHVENGIPIAVLIQYGHATRNGGYVQGYDYINPALAPIFRQIADDMWKVVTR